MEQQNTPLTVKGCFIWGICALFFLYEFLLRTVMGTFQHPIMYDFDLTTFQFSLLSTTMYLLVYGLMQIPVGLIVDRYGLKKSLLFAVLMCAAAVIGFAYATQHPMAAFFRFMMGLGSSFGFICLLVAVYDWMPNQHSGLLIGLSQFIGTLGPMIAAGPLESIAYNANTHWRDVFIILGIIGIGLAVIVAFFVNNNHSKAGNYLILHRPASAKGNLKILIARLQPWSIALFSACVYFSLEYLSENDGKTFIALKGHSPQFAAYMLTLGWLGYALGCPLLGFLSDYWQRRKRLMIFAAVCYVTALLMIMFLTHKWLLMIAFFLLGLATSGQSIGFVTIAEQFKRQYRAVGLSLNNAVIMTFASLNAPAIGWMIDRSKKTILPSMSDYSAAFFILLGIAVIGLICALWLIKETFCKSAVDFTYLKRTE